MRTALAGWVLTAWLLPALAFGAPPNLVFVLVDDLRHDGFGRVNPALDTPHIDDLAASGVYLPNAVVTTSLCSPSRATILTGQSTRNHRIVDNNDASEAHLTFFPQHLQDAGYQTAFIGKWHMGRANAEPRPGFGHWVSFPGQGYYNPTDGLTPAQVAQGMRRRLNVNGREVDQAGYITDELTDYALQWLQATARDRPFFLYLSHKAVHADFAPADRHQGRYAEAPIKVPDPDADRGAAGAGKPMWVHNQRNSWHGVDFPYHNRLAVGEFMRRYYETLAAVDDSVGRLRAWLRDAGLLENTVFIFFSDNGFLFGEHGLIDKRNAYEASVRVPMIVSAPGRIPAGAVVNNRVRNLDLAPTLLDFAGVSAPAQFEGRSLGPLLTGKVAAADFPDVPFVYEYYWEWTFPQTPTTFAVTVDEIKYIQYHGLWDLEELYDLTADPNERVNLIHDPAYLGALVERRAVLYDALANRDGEHVVPFTEKRAQGLRFRRRDGSSAAEFPESFLREPGAADVFSGFAPPAVDRESDRSGRRGDGDGR